MFGRLFVSTCALPPRLLRVPICRLREESAVSCRCSCDTFAPPSPCPRVVSQHILLGGTFRFCGGILHVDAASLTSYAGCGYAAWRTRQAVSYALAHQPGSVFFFNIWLPGVCPCTVQGMASIDQVPRYRPAHLSSYSTLTTTVRGGYVCMVQGLLPDERRATKRRVV